MNSRIAIATRAPRHQRGLSLLELMIALGLGAFLMLGLVNMFLSSRSSAQVETALSRIQDNGRAALQLVSQDILRAGYKGCNSVRGKVTVLAKNTVYESVRGYERSTTWTPVASAPATANILSIARDGSDVLALQAGISYGRDLLTADVTPSDTAISISANPDGAIAQNDLILLSGCLTAHLVKVTNSPAATGATTVEYGSAGNNSSTIEPGYRYTAETELMRLDNVAWYVADTGRDLNGFDVWSLYRISVGDTHANADEMIEGVENMQVLYGERTTGGSTRFVNAANVSDWDRVVAVRVALLMQSFELVRNDPDTSSYQLLDQTISASSTPAAHSSGLAVRKVFNTTLALRNTEYDL